MVSFDLQTAHQGILGTQSGLSDKQEEGPVMPRGSLISTSGRSLLGGLLRRFHMLTC